MVENILYINVTKAIVGADGPINLVFDLSINIGELMVLFGPSGEGKTTILRMVAGLLKPDKGRICFNNQVWFDSELGIDLPPQKRRVGMVFQDYALFPAMTVRQNLIYAQPKPDITDVNRLLDLFGLTELAKRKPNQLSGGQMQRVALARALASKPILLLLDEPLSALDTSMRNKLQNVILLAHNDQKTTTILVSHDLSEVFRLATRVAILQNHKVFKVGSADNLFINQQIAGKFQIVGQVVRIEPYESMFFITVVTGQNQLVKVIAFENDMENIEIGNTVMVFTKALNPMIVKVKV